MGIARAVEALERVGKMQGMNVPFPMGTNVPAVQTYPSQRVHLYPSKKLLYL
jgi:hypothetical protein